MKEMNIAVLVPARTPVPISSEVSNFYQKETTSYKDLVGNRGVDPIRSKDEKYVVYQKTEDDAGAAPPATTRQEGHSLGVGH
ncbi:hypothetical protein SUGI_0700880 [Cryptomeria japonica]|nr:hypothetical protein SUGI_0700880 [Cryptomeria japonica]